jgi:hypothetical protein
MTLTLAKALQELRSLCLDQAAVNLTAETVSATCTAVEDFFKLSFFGQDHVVLQLLKPGKVRLCARMVGVIAGHTAADRPHKPSHLNSIAPLQIPLLLGKVCLMMIQHKELCPLACSLLKPLLHISMNLRGNADAHGLFVDQLTSSGMLAKLPQLMHFAAQQLQASVSGDGSLASGWVGEDLLDSVGHLLAFTHGMLLLSSDNLLRSCAGHLIEPAAQLAHATLCYCSSELDQLPVIQVPTAHLHRAVLSACSIGTHFFVPLRNELVHAPPLLAADLRMSSSFRRYVAVTLVSWDGMVEHACTEGPSSC